MFVCSFIQTINNCILYKGNVFIELVNNNNFRFWCMMIKKGLLKFNSGDNDKTAERYIKFFKLNNRLITIIMKK